MSTILSKVQEFFGMEPDEELIEEEIPQPAPEPVGKTNFTPRKGKVVNIHTTTQLKVVVLTPESFDEAREIADNLKAKRPVVINLEGLEKDIARRIVDFLSGAVYSLDGNIQKISSGIFLVAPYNVGIMGDFRDELKNTGVFPWN